MKVDPTTGIHEFLAQSVWLIFLVIFPLFALLVLFPLALCVQVTAASHPVIHAHVDTLRP